MAIVVLKHWIGPYGIPNTILSDYNSQILSTFFTTLCVLLGTKLVTTTKYHPQSCGQVKSFKKRLVDALQLYIDDHQTDWYMYIEKLAYGSNTQVHRTTETSPFCFILSQTPPGSLSSARSSTLEEFFHVSPEQAKLRIVEKIVCL